MAGTFISYRRDDAAGYAGRLHESLERRLGAPQLFRDVDTLQPGQDFVNAIEARLAVCKVMLVIIGREWLDARNAAGTRRLDDPFDFVRLEIAAGLARPDVLVVPVLVEGASMPAAVQLPENMRALVRRHAVSVRDETWDADVDRLAAVVEKVAPPPASLESVARALKPKTIAAVAGAIALLIALAVWMPSRGRSGEPSPPAGSLLFNPLLVHLRHRLAFAANTQAEAVLRLNIGIALMRLGNWDDARIELERTALPDVPGVAQGTVQYHLGTCYEKLGRFTDAAQAWKKAAASAALLTEDGPPIKELAEARLAGAK